MTAANVELHDDNLATLEICFHAVRDWRRMEMRETMTCEGENL